MKKMNKSLIVASNELEYLVRGKTFFLILFLFIIMTLASTYIGWSAQHTIKKVYLEAVRGLQLSGKPVPLSPLSYMPPLSIVENMVIYTVLIGSLFAITIGHTAGMRDRKAGAVKLLFSRQLTKEEFLLGKILAVFFILFTVMLVCMIISGLSVSVLTRISFAEFIKLAEFYSLSFVYLASFALIGLGFAFIKRNNAVALLLPIIIWIVITFVLPELSSALYPTSSLNPVLPKTDVLNSPILMAMHRILYPFSVSEHYKNLSLNILGIQHHYASKINMVNYQLKTHLTIVILWTVVAVFVAAFSIFKFDISQGDIYE